MKPSEFDLLDEIAREARMLEPVSRAHDDDALIAHAALAGRARHEAAASRRRAVIACCTVLGVAACVALLWKGQEAPAPDAIVELTLPTGDRLSATGDARFDVISSETARRVVRLTQGAMLFDVAPLRPGSHFEVETPTARIRVRGTVFSVETSDRGTAVSTYEGRVEVCVNGTSHVLDAGASHGAEVASERLGLLESRGRAAATRRVRVSSAAISPGEGESIIVSRSEPRAVGHELPAESRGASVTERRDGARARPRQSQNATEPADEGLAVAREPSVDPAARILEADALRASGQLSEAADAYEDAARRLSGPMAYAPAFLAAELRLEHLRDAAGTLRVLDETRIDQRGSPFRERGLVLRAEALDRLGRAAELQDVAEQYVAEMPDGPRRDWMRARMRPE